jgi:hypothetical protein
VLTHLDQPGISTARQEVSAAGPNVQGCALGVEIPNDSKRVAQDPQAQAASYTHQPQQERRPIDNRPHRRPTTAPHTAPAQRTTRRRTIKKAGPQLPTTQRRVRAQIQEANVLPNSSISAHRDEHQGHRAAIIDRIRKALRPGNPPQSKGKDQLWS